MSDRPHLPVGRARSRRICDCLLQMRELPHPYRPILSIEWVLRPGAGTGERRDVMSKPTVFQRWKRANQLPESRNRASAEGGGYTDDMRNSIAGQEEQHRKWTFEQEFFTFLRKPARPLETRIRMTLCRPFIRRGGPACAFRMGLENDSTGEIS